MSECPFCLEDIHVNSGEVCVATHCNHVMHKHCFVEFLQYNLQKNTAMISCPLCRHVIVELIPLSNNANNDAVQLTHHNHEQNITTNYFLNKLVKWLVISASGIGVYIMLNILFADAFGL